MTITYRDYTFLGTTQSLCPECLGLVPAKIVSRDGRVYFRKNCLEHGPREDFVCSDVRWFDRTDFSWSWRPFFTTVTSKSPEYENRNELKD